MHASSGATAHSLPHRTRWGAISWVGILLAIGIVQVVREQWFDACVFFGVSAVLVVDGVRPLARNRARGAPRRPPAAHWIRAGAVAVGLIACIVPRHSPLMQALVCAVGVAAIVLVWPQGRSASDPASPAAPRPDLRWPPGARRLAWGWAIIVIAGCLWELAQFITGLVHPQNPAFALSDLLDPLVSTWAGRAVFIALWLTGGAYLVARGRA